MPATTTTTELIAKSVFTLLQVQAQRDLRIQAGAIRSTIAMTTHKIRPSHRQSMTAPTWPQAPDMR